MSYRSVEHDAPDYCNSLLRDNGLARLAGSTFPTAPKRPPGVELLQRCSHYVVWYLLTRPDWLASDLGFLWLALTGWLSFDCALCGLLAIISIAIGALGFRHGRLTPRLVLP